MELSRHIRRFELLCLDSQSNVFVKLYLQYVIPKMNFGLAEMINSGIRCRVIRICSRVNEGLIGCKWWVNFPRCDVISMWSE